MKNNKLESLIVSLDNHMTSDELQNSLETLRLSLEVINEVKKAKAKCQAITQIDDMPASVVGLTITGTESVETIGIRYISNNESHCRKYAKQDFYKL
jgi:hypothetical protein